MGLRSTYSPHNFQRHSACWMRWTVSAGLVLFYLLASARALIPGLCATQSANDAQCGAPLGKDAISSTAHHCCPTPAAESDDDDGDRRPVTPAESHCAFCNLLIAHIEPSIAVDLPTPSPWRFPDQIPLVAQLAQTVDFGATPNRAPPA